MGGDVIQKYLSPLRQNKRVIRKREKYSATKHTTNFLAIAHPHATSLKDSGSQNLNSGLHQIYEKVNKIQNRISRICL